mgnify:CR=1 FL=1
MYAQPRRYADNILYAYAKPSSIVVTTVLSCLLAGATVGVHISQEEADQAPARALVDRSGTGGAALVEVMKTIDP